MRTGHARRLAELGPWNTAELKAGLHPTTMGFVSERSVAVLGSVGNSDTAPSSTQGVDFPIHVLAIAAMGVHLLDYLQSEDLRTHCEGTGRWEFLFACAPLPIVGGTGSPGQSDRDLLIRLLVLATRASESQLASGWLRNPPAARTSPALPSKVRARRRAPSCRACA